MGESQEFGSLYQVLAGLLEQLSVRSGSALILWVDFHRRAPAALGNLVTLIVNHGRTHPGISLWGNI